MSNDQSENANVVNVSDAAGSPGDDDRLSRLAALVEKAKAANHGSEPWVHWKDEAVDDIAELAAKAPRMEMLDINLEGDLNAVYRIAQPAPRWPHGEELVIGDEAVFHLHYREDWRWQSPEGWEPLGLFKPVDPFHPNMRPSLRGAICLGDLPPATLPKEIILMGYSALTMQVVALNETDPHGVMNAQACEFFRSHPDYMPLTEAGLFDDWAKPEPLDVSQGD